MGIIDRMRVLKSAAFTRASSLKEQLRAAGAGTKLTTQAVAHDLRATYIETSYLLAIDKELTKKMTQVAPQIKATLPSAQQMLLGTEKMWVTVQDIQKGIAHMEADIKNVKKLMAVERKYTGLNSYSSTAMNQRNTIVRDINITITDARNRLAEIFAKLELLERVTMHLQAIGKTAIAEHTKIYQFIRYARGVVNQYGKTLTGLEKV